MVMELVKITATSPPWYRKPDRGALFGVFDAAASNEVLRGLADSREPFLSLFEERGDAVLAEAAPHLIELDLERPWARKILDEGWGSAWAIFLRAPLALQPVRKHLRRLLTAQLPDGRKVMFRFYDPRVLGLYLPTCLPSELEAFFGPIEAFYAFREDEDTVDVFTRAADGRLAIDARPGPGARGRANA